MTSAMVLPILSVYPGQFGEDWPKPPECRQGFYKSAIPVPHLWFRGGPPGPVQEGGLYHDRQDELLLSWLQIYPNEGLAVKPNSIKKIFWAEGTTLPLKGGE